MLYIKYNKIRKCMRVFQILFQIFYDNLKKKINVLYSWNLLITELFGIFLYIREKWHNNY